MNVAGQVRDDDLVGILAELHGEVQALRGDLVGVHQTDQVEDQA
jgi:hypothetical protein